MSKKKLIAVITIMAIALASLSAHPYYSGHSRPGFRGEWFSLGFGAGTDVLTMPVDGSAGPQSFSSLAINTEFAMFPQRAQGNFVLRIAFGILQEEDVFGRVPEGGTMDITAMYRWQHSSGFALGIGGGCFIPGFAEGLKPSPEAVVEPSFAFNLIPGTSSASMGTVRISLPIEARYDMALGEWYMNVSVAATVYVV